MKVRRFSGESNPLFQRRVLVGLGVVAGASLLGYLLAVLVIFPAPPGEGGGLVPRVLDQSLEEAQAKLVAEGYRARLEGESAHPTAPAGTVIWQDPPPETIVPRGGLVRLTVSAGPEVIPVPDLVGLEVGLARTVLAQAGFRTVAADTVAAPSEPGTVVASRPAAGATRMPDDPITLVVSRGSADISVPDLVGLQRDEAMERLTRAGLFVGFVRQREMPGTRDGVVLEQRPSAGSRMARNGRVDLTLSRMP
jgi:serine/threonine-protein kinase